MEDKSEHYRAADIQLKGLAPGLYFGLDESIYREDAALNYSSMKDILQGESHFWHSSRMNPDYSPRTTTDQMRFGSALHSILLEPDKFDERYMVMPGGMMHDNRQIIRRSDYLEMLDMIRTLKRYIDRSTEIKTLLDNGFPEVSVVWMDDATGIRCKARHDYFKTFTSVDYKTMDAVDNDTVKRSTWRFGYDMQFYLYHQSRVSIRQQIKDGKADVYGDVDMAFVDEFLNETVDGFNFIYQMRKKPYTPRVSHPSMGTWNSGATNVRDAIARYCEGLERWGVAAPWGVDGGFIEEFDMYNGFIRS